MKRLLVVRTPSALDEDELELQDKILSTLPTFEIDPPVRAIYFLFQGRRVVYVGQTCDLLSRIIFHTQEGSKLFDSVRYLVMPVGNMNAVEEEFIVRLRPLYNGRKTWLRTSLTKIDSNNRMIIRETIDHARIRDRNVV